MSPHIVSEARKLIWENPLRLARQATGLPQSYIALSAQVSVGVVTQLEVGLYNSPPPSVLEVLSKEATIPVETLREAYLDWQHRNRVKNAHYFDAVRFAIRFDPAMPLETIVHLSGPTDYAFCRKLLFQSSELYVALKKGRCVPLTEALEEVGINWQSSKKTLETF